ncbi:MAG: helix-turn-helix transcriptional regulator [Chloroflexi bacterium]|nr:helix-turn-helix transcriptional regulator [Chloroflexota bacterium]
MSAGAQDALVDDRRVGALIRAVRVQRGWRQRDLAAAAGQSTSTVSRAELGRLDEVSVPAIRALGAALDIRLEFAPWWRGGDLDRVVNAGHTAMHEVVAARLARLSGWTTEAEVTFSIYGERGSIDLLAFHAASGSLLVVELKTEIPDPAGLVAQVDRYVRLARTVAAERGWVAGGGPLVRGAGGSGAGGSGAAVSRAAGGGAVVSRWVVVAESSMNRRQVTRHRALLRNAFPTDGRAIDGWLADPRAPIACMSFIGPDPGAPTQTDPVPAARSGSQGARAASSGSRPLAAVRRVRPRRGRSSARGEGLGGAGLGGSGSGGGGATS